MNKRIIFLFLLVVILIALSLVFSAKTSEVCIKNYCFRARKAITADEQRRGLSFVKKLPLDKGMLFIMPQDGYYPFWMKDTLLPLDIIWFDQNKKINFISTNNQPCDQLFSTCPLINSQKPARYILEINAGLANKYDFKIGDPMNF